MARTCMEGCRKGWHVAEMLALIVSLLNCAEATAGNRECNARCNPPASSYRPPDRCLLGDLCPISKSPPSLTSSIVARMHVEYQLDGCADPLEPLTTVFKRNEVHGFWLPKLFGASSMRNTLQLELRHLQSTMLDRPVVIAIMADVSAMKNVTVDIDMRSLSLTGSDLRFIVSQGVVVCGVNSSRMQVIRNVFREPVDSFSWLWKQHDVIHTFISGSAAGLINDVEHITLNIGHGYQLRQDSTDEKSCRRNVHDAPKAVQAAALDHMMTLTRLGAVRSTKPAKKVLGCTIDGTVAAACPGYKFLKTPHRHLFVIEAYSPYSASEIKHAGIDGDTSPEIVIEVDVVADATALSGATGQEVVNIVLINRSQRSVCWEVGSRGMNSKSKIVVGALGGQSSVEVTPGVENIRQESMRRVDTAYLNNHALLEVLQTIFNTTVTAYAQTHEATLFQLRIPTAMPTASSTAPSAATGLSSAAAVSSTESMQNPRCLDTGLVRHTSCVDLSSAVMTQCNGELFSVSVALSKLRASGWDTADMLVTLGDKGDACKLEPVAGDDSVLALSAGKDRCGIAQKAKGRGLLQAEIVFTNASCPGALCAGTSSSCTVQRQHVHRVDISCTTDARSMRKGGRLTAYTSGKFITPHSSWVDVKPGQVVFFEVDLSSKVHQGVAPHPVDCSFHPTSGENLPVLKDGCAFNKGRALSDISLTHYVSPPSVTTASRHFRTTIPRRDDLAPVVALVCTVALCSLHKNGSRTLCEEIDRNCMQSNGKKIDHVTVASSGLFHVLPTADSDLDIAAGSQGAIAHPTQSAPSKQETGQAEAGCTPQQQVTVDTERTTLPQSGDQTTGGVSVMIVVVLCVSSLLVGSALSLLVVLLKREADTLRARREEEAAGQAARRDSRQSGFGKSDLRRQSSSLQQQQAYLSARSREISSLARSVSTDTSVSLSGTRSSSTATTATVLTPDTESY